MANKEINRTWTLYEAMVLQGKSDQLKDEAFKGFIGGWASAYKFMMGLMTTPAPDGHWKIVDLKQELDEIQAAVQKRVKGLKK